jgi:hypothetical protein
MKKITIFATIITTFVLIGCAGHRDATYNASTGHYSENNFSILLPPTSPTEMANAELTSAMAQRILNNQSTKNMNYFTGVIINEHGNKTAYVYHPEMSRVITIQPNGYAFLLCEQIPENVTVRFGNGNSEQRKIYKTNKTYNGVEIDFGARIH